MSALFKCNGSPKMVVRQCLSGNDGQALGDFDQLTLHGDDVRRITRVLGKIASLCREPCFKQGMFAGYREIDGLSGLC